MPYLPNRRDVEVLDLLVLTPWAVPECPDCERRLGTPPFEDVPGYALATVIQTKPARWS